MRTLQGRGGQCELARALNGCVSTPGDEGSVHGTRSVYSMQCTSDDAQEAWQGSSRDEQRA
eukprot:3051444-Lingulodinium_polyedra.AAC.1